MTVWVGADWDIEKCVVEVEREGETWRSKVARTPEAVGRWVAGLGQGQIVVGIEAGDPLWVGLWERAGAEVFVFDAKKAKNFARSLSSSNASDDKRSAETLRLQVQSPAHRRKANRSTPTELRGSQRLLSVHDVVSDEITRHTNRLNSLLRQVHPALRNALGKLDRVGVVRLLGMAPTPRAWEELTSEDRAVALKGFHSKRRAQVVVAMADDWAHMSVDEDAAARLQVRQIVAVLQVLLRQRKEADEALEESVPENPVASIAVQIDGLGSYLSTGAAVALGGSSGQRDRMARRTALAPVTARSGTRGDASPRVFMRRSSSTNLRKIGYLIAAQLVSRHAWAKAQFAHYKAKGINSPGAFRRVGRSFGRVLEALVRDDVPFDEHRYVQALKSKGVTWAMEL